MKDGREKRNKSIVAGGTEDIGGKDENGNTSTPSKGTWIGGSVSGDMRRERCELVRTMSATLKCKEDIRRDSEGLDCLFGILPSDMRDGAGETIHSKIVDRPEDEKGIMLAEYTVGEDGADEGEDEVYGFFYND